MKLIMAVLDKGIELYSTPFFVRTEHEAIRMYQDSKAEPNSVINKHPDDFQLYKLGLFNEETGEIQGMTPTMVEA